ncbi:TPA: IS21-like element helper ATPase IstB [Citrobacter freundii]|jgi:DNA replication protein DnaC|uniref:IS21-like element helper ATPase IstB n=1 Tax=Escherichia coli TaxID=562 RepID=UPI001A62EB26|nr:IS21-like element helper ATPase IstB [Escherichia coli]VVZ89014.1 transposase [Escherichia coli]VWM82959.1 transposase [Escherichia coli]HCB1584437.1 IS21-like element helper ATPase IstB [Citrobacter freundii]HEE9901946.1 IS21-like element helper ATPase IstB [Citrobacter freundii]
MNQLTEQLKTLRLSHAARALEQQQEQLSTYAELSFEERLSLLLGCELQGREKVGVARLKRQAKLRLSASSGQLIYKESRGLNRRQISELLTGTYLNKHQNILITGPTGAGKTYLGCALGEQACNQQYSVRYSRLSRLLDELAAGRLDGTFQKQLTTLAKKDLLILDDWGMEKLSGEQSNHLLELLEDRYQTSSTIMVSQLPVSDWYSMIGNATVADAILDRLIHNSHRIELSGESMRKLEQTGQLK